MPDFCYPSFGMEAPPGIRTRSAVRSVQYSALRLSGRFDPFYKTFLHILPLPVHPRSQDCLRFVKSHLLRRLKPSREEWLLSHAVVVKTPMCARRHQ